MHLAARKDRIEFATKLPISVSLERTSGFDHGSETVEVVTRLTAGHSRVSAGHSFPKGSTAACERAMAAAALRIL